MAVIEAEIARVILEKGQERSNLIRTIILITQPEE